MKKLILACAAPLALTATPVLAQEGGDEPRNAFAAAALTAEEEARLPAAEGVVAQVFPQGTYRKMMDASMEPMLNAITESMKAMPMAQIAAMTGMTTEDMSELGDASVGELMAIIDPAFEERIAISNRIFISLTNELMDEIEPSYRNGLMRAYAVRFTEAELADISAFFATGTGRKYAPESILLFTDPQVMSVMGEMMPAMMERMPELTKQMTAEMEGLPKPKKIEELSESEKARLADILGIDPEEIRNQGG